VNSTPRPRRLAAILAADVAGYTRLVEQDTDRTVAAWKAARDDVIKPLVTEKSGRIIKFTGDGFLVEFPSVQDAVSCAIGLQEQLASNPLKFRMGLNVGDITDDGVDVHGEGVNIAARIEALADPGGICVSGDVHNQVRNRIDCKYDDMGEHQVKHVSEPVRVYRIVVDGGEPAIDPIAIETVDLDLPDKPSVVVLPFDNMSGDPEQEYFADGITEDLTTALSRFDWLFVIARNSAFTYKGEAVDVKRVGRELGVRYVLEGSVRRMGDRVRINAQLIDAGTGRHVWAERFDRQMEDVFAVQDDIVASIAAVGGPEITSAEIKRAQDKRPDKLGAWDHYLRAISAYRKMTRDDAAAAISFLEAATAIDPEFANAYALLGICHAHIGARGWIRPARQAFEKARLMVEEAVRRAPSSPETNHALAFVLMITGHADEAITAARRAIDLNPNFAEAYAVLGHAQTLCGELREGLAACQQAIRCNPRDTRGSWVYDSMGHAYCFLGDYEQAIEVSKKGLFLDPSLYGAHVTLAISYAHLGRADDAKRAVDALLRDIPRYNLRALRKNPMFVQPELIDKLVEGMRLAGLPE
jgi:adenylate cyclase